MSGFLNFLQKGSFSPSPTLHNSLSSQPYFEIISKLYSPSCLHVQWESLNAMEDEDLLDNRQVLSKELEFSFTKSEYDFGLNSIKLRSAPGLDQIDFKIIVFLLSQTVTLIHSYTFIIAYSQKVFFRSNRDNR